MEIRQLLGTILVTRWLIDAFCVAVNSFMPLVESSGEKFAAVSKPSIFERGSYRLSSFVQGLLRLPHQVSVKKQGSDQPCAMNLSLPSWPAPKPNRTIR
jgi:hypothetical protein